MVFQAGQSGNPLGRPPKDWTWAGLIEEEAERIDDTDPSKKRKIKETITKAVMKKAQEGDVQAYREIANRTDGMPKETQDITLTLPKPLLGGKSNGNNSNNSDKEDIEIDSGD